MWKTTNHIDQRQLQHAPARFMWHLQCISVPLFNRSPSKWLSQTRSWKSTISPDHQYVARRHHTRKIKSKYTQQLGIAVSSQDQTHWFWVLWAPSNPCSMVPFLNHMHPQPCPEAKEQNAFTHISQSDLPGKLSSVCCFKYRIIAKTSSTVPAFSLNPRASHHKTSHLLPKREASSYNQCFHWGEQVQWRVDIYSSR